MGITQIIVLLGALALSILVVWFFFFSEKKETRLAAGEGMEEATIIVKGGYTPDVLVVKAGQPVRLNFNRQSRRRVQRWCFSLILIKAQNFPKARKYLLNLPR